MLINDYDYKKSVYFLATALKLYIPDYRFIIITANGTLINMLI